MKRIILFFISYSFSFCLSDVKKPLDKPSPPKETQSFLDKPIFENNELSFLATFPLQEGGLSFAGKELQRGFSIVFNRINALGGLSKKFFIRFNCKDDQNLANLAKKNVVQEIKNSSTFVTMYGLDNMANIWDEVVAQKFFLFAPAAGGSSYRNQSLKNVVFLRAPLEKEIEALIDFAVKEKKSRIAVFYEDSLFGKEGLKIAEEKLDILKKKDLASLVAKGFYPQNTVSVMRAVDEIVGKMPQAILLIGHYFPAYNFIQQALRARDPLPGGERGCLFLGINSMSPYQKVIRKNFGRLVLTSVVPSPVKSKIDIVKKYRAEMKENELSTLSLEAYLCAALLEQLLADLSNESTMNNLIKKIESFEGPFLDGPIKFDQKTRTLLSDVWINESWDQDWKKYDEANSVFAKSKDNKTSQPPKNDSGVKNAKE